MGLPYILIELPLVTFYNLGECLSMFRQWDHRTGYIDAHVWGRLRTAWKTKIFNLTFPLSLTAGLPFFFVVSPGQPFGLRLEDSSETGITRGK